MQSKSVQTMRLFWGISKQYPIRRMLTLLLPITTVIVGAFIGPFIISLFFTKIQSGVEISLTNTLPLILAYIATQIYGEIIGWRLVLYCVWTMETAAQRDAVVHAHRPVDLVPGRRRGRVRRPRPQLPAGRAAGVAYPRCV